MTGLSIFNQSIRIQNNLYSLNDLHQAAGGQNKHSPRYWTNNAQTLDLIAEIEKDGIPSIQKRPRKGTWVCKELVYAYAMWISAKFHLQVIRAFDAMANQQYSYPAIEKKGPIDEMNFIHQRWLVVVEKGVITNKRALSHDENLFNRRHFINYFNEPCVGFDQLDELLELSRAVNERIVKLARY
ncbi:KilA-N domain-containing protein [Vibrio gangliei]|uniref:KilA-N domain-containing protein n=1 Tax=Vibrio gangliei TaxID=2077090 RepID=UPI000D01ACDE|nr:KilA-N domain-containing protein [Vibrio gangliei]